MTGAEGDLFSPVGEGPSPTRQEPDRPAENGAGEGIPNRMAFETNAKDIRAVFRSAATACLRYRPTLQAFVRAGRKIIARLKEAGFGPPSDRPSSRGPEKSPNPYQP